MNVLHNVADIIGIFDVKSGLPNRALANIECGCTFIYSHHFRNRTTFGHIEEKMNMIRHDNECEQKERIEMLNAVESFYGNTSASWVCKDGNPVLGISSDKHELLILNGVPLKHDAILSYRGQKGRSLICRMKKTKYQADLADANNPCSIPL